MARLRLCGLTKLTPRIDPYSNIQYAYPEADALFGTEGEETVELLESFASKGLLRKTYAMKMRACPKCGSITQEFVEACPECGSRDIVHANEKLICQSCGASFFSPSIVLSCERCGNVFGLSKAKEKALYCYEIAATDAGVNDQGEGLRSDIEIIKEELKRLSKLVEELTLKVNRIAEAVEVKTASGNVLIEEFPEAGLNERLRPTYEVVLRKLCVTAEDVVAETGRSRGLESMYLNQLAALGLLSKNRVGKKAYFVLKGIPHALLKPAVEKLRAAGWTVESPATLRGTSGALHTFALVASSEAESGRPYLTLHTVIGTRPIGEEEVSSFYAMASDVGARVKVLMGIQPLSHRARKLAEFYGIRFVELSHPYEDSADNLADTLLRIVKEEK